MCRLLHFIRIFVENTYVFFLIFFRFFLEFFVHFLIKFSAELCKFAVSIKTCIHNFFAKKYHKIWIFVENSTKIISNSHTIYHFLTHFYNFHSVKYNLGKLEFHLDFQLFLPPKNHCENVWICKIMTLYSQPAKIPNICWKRGSCHPDISGKSSNLD